MGILQLILFWRQFSGRSGYWEDSAAPFMFYIRLMTSWAPPPPPPPPYPKQQLSVPFEISSLTKGRIARWWNGWHTVHTNMKPGQIITAGARRLAALGLQTHCPGARNRWPRGTVDRGSYGIPCWDNPSLSGSLPPGEWRTINLTTPPTLPGQWWGRVTDLWFVFTLMSWNNPYFYISVDKSGDFSLVSDAFCFCDLYLQRGWHFHCLLPFEPRLPLVLPSSKLSPDFPVLIEDFPQNFLSQMHHPYCVQWDKQPVSWMMIINFLAVQNLVPCSDQLAIKLFTTL